jgi:hypothetical protein
VRVLKIRDPTRLDVEVIYGTIHKVFTSMPGGDVRSRFVALLDLIE